MTKRTVVLAVVLVTCLPGCVDLNEDVVTGLTPGAYGSEAVFQALVNATYEPLRSFWAQERGFTLTEFGTDIFYKGADGSYKFVNDYTTEPHRSPVDSVYDGVIIPDLQYAETHLPSVQQDYGRATKGAVQHLLAKVYLTRLRVPDDSVADEVAKQQAGDFANAADYAQRVIKSGFYQLLPHFADVFDFH